MRPLTPTRLASLLRQSLAAGLLTLGSGASSAVENAVPVTSSPTFQLSRSANQPGSLRIDCTLPASAENNPRSAETTRWIAVSPGATLRLQNSSSGQVSIGEAVESGGTRLIPLTFSSPTDNPSAPVNISTVVSASSQSSPKPMRRVIREMWGSLILNSNELGRDQVTETPQGIYVVVIPDNNDVRNAISALLTHRKRQGYRVREILLQGWADDRTVTGQLQYIQQYEGPIDYILLVGDVGGPYTCPTPRRGVESDYYYAFLEGDDWIPDAAVGRLSFRSLAELQRITDKIVSYETTFDNEDTDWMYRASIATGRQASGFSTILLGRWLRDKFLASGMRDVDTLWHPDGGNVTRFMTDAFNRGTMWVNFRGWSGMDDWSAESAAQLTNSRLPVAILLACNSSDYTGEETAVTESLLRARGGAIGAIGIAGSQSRIDINNSLMAGFYKGVFDDGAYQLGWALNRARLEMMAQYGTHAREIALDHAVWANLMGDPATNLHTTLPRQVSLQLPNNVNYGTGTATVTVTYSDDNQPAVGVRVGMFKANEILAGAYTNERGEATLTFDGHLVSPGISTVTASGKGVLLASANLQLVRPQVRLGATGVSILDDALLPRNGNMNGVAEPHETIALVVSSVNYGDRPAAPPIGVRLTSDHPGVSITNGNSAHQQPIAANAAFTDTFLVYLTNYWPNTKPVTFHLDYQPANGNFASDVQLIGRAPDFKIAQVQTRAVPVPGVEYDFGLLMANVGSMAVGESHGTLHSLSDNVEMVNAEFDLESLERASFASTGPVLTIRPTENAAYNSEMLFRLHMLSVDTIETDLDFGIRIGPAPADQIAGPDGGGYYAVEDTDHSNVAPEFDWIEISPRQGGHGRDTGIRDRGEDDDTSVVVDLPFEMVYYGRRFHQLTICSNGWAAFGSQPSYVDFRALPIGSPQGPRAQICPWWSDLYQADPNGDVSTYFDPDNHCFIVEWSSMEHWIGIVGPGASQTFQLILYDPAWNVSETGDGDIVFQYLNIANEARADANGTPYATVGINNPDDNSGLQIGYWNDWSSGCTPPANNRAIRFATSSRHRYAFAYGRVTRARDGAPVPNTIIRSSTGGWTLTDVEGNYRFTEALVDIPLTLYALNADCNPGASGVNTIRLGDSARVDFSLRSPTFALDLTPIADSLDAGGMILHPYSIGNNGDGSLSYRVTVSPGPDENLQNQWERRFSFNVSNQVRDNRILGVGFQNGVFSVCGAANGNGTPKIYHFSPVGRYFDLLDQPVSDNWGFRDIAVAGQEFYGACRDWIYRMDSSGLMLDSLPSDFTPVRGIAVDPRSGEVWIASESESITRLSPEGEIIERFPHQLRITGLAWDDGNLNGQPLWILSADGATGVLLSTLDTLSGEVRGSRPLQSDPGDTPGGCELTYEWETHHQYLTTVMQSAAGDRIVVYEVGPNVSWLSPGALHQTVNPGAVVHDSLIVNASALQGGNYSATLGFTNAAGPSLATLQVNLVVSGEGIEQVKPAPSKFVLAGLYPNPANGAALIKFQLDAPAFVKLAVYDQAGRLATEIYSGHRPAGSQSLHFDGASLASGIYFIRMESSGSTQVSKFVMLR